MNELFSDINGSRDLNEKLDRQRTCRRCASVYTERENIGRWRCDAYHPLERFATTHDAVFQCCGRPRDAHGCVAADHTDVVMFDSGVKTISRQSVALLDVGAMAQRKSWRLNENGGYTVHRVDPDAYAASIDTTQEAADPALLCCPPMLLASHSVM
jgi:hypothetical protein